MDQFETANNSEQAWVDTESKSESEHPEQEPLPVMTRGQRWLAYATATAVLLSGLNAVVQVWRALAEVFTRHG